MRTEEDLYVETNYKIVFEDAYFLIIDKPAPLPVHAVGRFKEKNLLSLLKKDLVEKADELRIVNRLDSETSGLLIVAKSKEIAGKLGTLFERRQVTKEYIAIVFGKPQPEKGTLSFKLGTDIRSIQHVRIQDPLGETAVTDYELLESFEEYSLLKVIPKTGRTHQIRAHLAFAGCPIVGDKIYIDPQIFDRYVHEGWQEEMRNVVKCERLLLHACALEFIHPETLEGMKFRSEAPFDHFLTAIKP